MKRIVSILLLSIFITSVASAQTSTSSGVSRRSSTSELRTSPRSKAAKPQPAAADANDEGSLAWKKVVYRSLDLTKPENAALYFPETPVDGEENMFRIMMRILADGSAAGYEYLDGHEAFDDAHRINVAEMLDRFHVPYAEGKGHSERHPVYAIETADVPAEEVLSYYLIESWEVDRHTTRMSTRILAICPVLHRVGEFGQEAVRYPMFWMRYADLRPFIADRAIFTDDDNNLATSTYDDFFALGLYNGEIYKTRNLRNKSLMQLYPDPDDLTRARDSIDRRLTSFESNLWVPSLEELEKRAASGDTTTIDADTPKRRAVKSSRVVSRRKADKKNPEKKSRRASTGATRSVRDRR